MEELEPKTALEPETASPSAAPGSTLYVIMLDETHPAAPGRGLTLQVTPTNTNRDVKTKIQQEEGIPLDQQCLSFMSKNGHSTIHSEDLCLLNDNPTGSGALLTTKRAAPLRKRNAKKRRAHSHSNGAEPLEPPGKGPSPCPRRAR